MYAQHCGPLIRQIHTTVEKELNNSMRNIDLTHAQVCLLSRLIQAPGGQLPMKELEKRMGVAQSTTAGLVKRLEEKGLVLCLSDPSDRRSKQVRITPQGQDRHQRTVENVDRNEAWLLHALTPEERVQFHDMLLRIYRSISTSTIP